MSNPFDYGEGAGGGVGATMKDDDGVISVGSTNSDDDDHTPPSAYPTGSSGSVDDYGDDPQKSAAASGDPVNLSGETSPVKNGRRWDDYYTGADNNNNNNNNNGPVTMTTMLSGTATNGGGNNNNRNPTLADALFDDDDDATSIASSPSLMIGAAAGRGDGQFPDGLLLYDTPVKDDQEISYGGDFGVGDEESSLDMTLTDVLLGISISPNRVMKSQAGAGMAAAASSSGAAGVGSRRFNGQTRGGDLESPSPTRKGSRMMGGAKNYKSSPASTTPDSPFFSDESIITVDPALHSDGDLTRMPKYAVFKSKWCRLPRKGTQKRKYVIMVLFMIAFLVLAGVILGIFYAGSGNDNDQNASSSSSSDPNAAIPQATSAPTATPGPPTQSPTGQPTVTPRPTGSPSASPTGTCTKRSAKMTAKHVAVRWGSC